MFQFFVAGKSTLLSVLAGRKVRGVTCGAVRVNGVKTSLKNRRELVSYVIQESLLPGAL